MTLREFLWLTKQVLLFIVLVFFAYVFFVIALGYVAALYEPIAAIAVFEFSIIVMLAIVTLDELRGGPPKTHKREAK